MILYNEKKELRLTVGQMLSLQLALYDGITQNKDKGRPRLAEEYSELLTFIRSQTDEWIDAADKECRGIKEANRQE